MISGNVLRTFASNNTEVAKPLWGEKEKQIPVVVYLRLWFGKVMDRCNLDKAMKPEVVQYFAEVFENERRHIGGQWMKWWKKEVRFIEVYKRRKK